MKTKEEIVTNWLPRYTDTPVEAFGKYILLTNFISYVHDFALHLKIGVESLRELRNSGESVRYLVF